MSGGISDTETGPDARWARASARAEGLTDLGLGAGVRRYYGRLFPVAVLASLGLVFLCVFLWPPRAGNVVLAGLAWGLMLAGPAAGLAGMIYGSRKLAPLVQPRRIGVTIGLHKNEVRRVERQVLGKEPAGIDVTLLRGAAVQMRERLARYLVAWPGFTIFLWGQAVNLGAYFVMTVLPFLLGLMVVLWVWVRQFRQAGDFLGKTAKDRRAA